MEVISTCQSGVWQPPGVMWCDTTIKGSSGVLHCFVGYDDPNLSKIPISTRSNKFNILEVQSIQELNQITYTEIKQFLSSMPLPKGSVLQNLLESIQRRGNHGSSEHRKLEWVVGKGIFHDQTDLDDPESCADLDLLKACKQSLSNQVGNLETEEEIRSTIKDIESRHYLVLKSGVVDGKGFDVTETLPTEIAEIAAPVRFSKIENVFEDHF